ncbi:MAG: 50S ribosomal protein L18a [Candidatus Diapherotrites archaeon]|uniref:Large ribosomal subunit protein eL20 n=1 Tax=Candidatus Iainarchaeum sp. TaxID=3101447 RepID=A0A938YTE1_9ARCH|nr:50S ribosomal protein L18a [Candidatus Diapherotrites archaeon]
MDSKIFLVEGEIIVNEKKQKFSKKVRAGSSSFAAEKTMALFGSKNRLRRNKILIKEVKEVLEDGTKKRN